MIRFKITKNVVLNTIPRHLPSYSMYTIIAKIYKEENNFLSVLGGYIVLEKPK